MNILLGNSFPLSLVRRNISIKPQSVEALKSAISVATLYSYWGHSNTIALANDILGCDITPTVERPVIRLNQDGYPQLNEITFDSCWLLSPDYITGFRPKIGEEVSAEQIVNWQVLKIIWDY